MLRKRTERGAFTTTSATTTSTTIGSVSYARSETFCKYKVWFIVFFWRCETFIEINGNALRHWTNGYNFENYNRRS